MELLSFQYPYNTPDLDHSPSYDFAFATPDDLPLALGRGWYVNVPDHEGPLAAIGANVGQGHATLDSIRAVLNADFGLDADAKYAMWGYSGGALASEWAAELQVQYAPELSIAGAALGGSPANITSVWDESNKSPYSGMMALSLVGPMRLYPEAQAYLYSQLKVEGEFNRTGFLHVEKLSAFEAFAYFAGQDMWEYFEGGRSILDQPVLRDVMDDNYYMGYHGVPQMPLFMYHAINDEVARIERAEELINRYCGVHVDIMFERNTVGTHIDEMANGRERALDWLSGVLAGSEQARGCTTKNVTVEATA
jgi:hypothetical protein